MAKLVITDGHGCGTAFDLGDKVTIGRSSQNTIQLFDEQVSREHARIACAGGTYTIEDLESRNGVIVNGQKVRRCELRPGDEVLIGETKLVFDPQYDIKSAKEGERGVMFYFEKAVGVTSAIRASVRADTAPQPTVVSGTAEEIEIANRYLKAIFDISNAVHSTMELQKLLDRILDVTLDAFGQERGVILLYEGEELRPAAMRPQASDGQPGDELAVSRTIVSRVTSRREAVATTDAMKDKRFADSHSISLYGMRSVMCAPLIKRGAVLGVIQVESRKDLRGFTERDLQLLVAIGGQAASAIQDARAYGELKKQNVALSRRLGSGVRIIGKSPAFVEALKAVEKVAPTDATVLLLGETGTGKELVAALVHERSKRKSGPFVCFNCAAVSENLVESELFGHEKGAFTGAIKMKPGLFEVADGGTIFLDEVGDISPGVQVKLLRVVDNKVFNRVGGVKPIRVDVRIVAASSRNLKEMVAEGSFREDLYYRLSVVPVQLPPLRERNDDVPLLVDHFFSLFASNLGKSISRITPEAMAILKAYAWPGNVRELQNVIERMVVLCDGAEISVEHLPLDVVYPHDKNNVETLVAGKGPLSDKLMRLEKMCIQRALIESRGKKVDAARRLGISRPTLDKRIKEFGLKI